MNFSKTNECFEKSKFWISYLFVFISILSMSSLVYKVTNPVYKGLSAVVVLCICLTLLLNWKRIEIDKKFLGLLIQADNLSIDPWRNKERQNGYFSKISKIRVF